MLRSHLVILTGTSLPFASTRRTFPRFPSPTHRRFAPANSPLPSAIPLGFVGALTTGVIHAVGPLQDWAQHSWVQADVRLAPGNSGGPLADAAWPA